MTKQERNELIVKDYLSGIRFKDVCKKYGVDNISRMLRRAGVKTRGYVAACKKSQKPKIRKERPQKVEITYLADTTDIDRKWVDKQIIALTNQGYTTRKIMRRYHIKEARIAGVRREAGIILQGKKNLQQKSLMFDGFAIPEMETCLDAKPRPYKNHFSQVIWR